MQKIANNIGQKNLDVLWIDANTFSLLKKNRLVFSFLMDSNGKICMDGWSLKGRQNYNTTPDLKLNYGVSTDIPYTAGSYLGNIFISKKGVKRLQSESTLQSAQYIAFLPLDSNNSNSPGHLQYLVFPTSENPSQQIPQPLIKPFSLIMNPSPPGTAHLDEDDDPES